MLLLIINPGSTSTKIAVYEDEREVLSENIPHSAEELAPFNKIVDQKGFRKDIVLRTIKAQSVEPSELAAVVGRGGSSIPSRAAFTGSTTRCSRISTRGSRESTLRTLAA